MHAAVQCLHSQVSKQLFFLRDLKAAWCLQRFEGGKARGEREVLSPAMRYCIEWSPQGGFLANGKIECGEWCNSSLAYSGERKVESVSSAEVDPLFHWYRVTNAFICG